MKHSVPPPFVVPVREFKRMASRFTFSSRPDLTSIHGSDLLPLRQLRDDLARRNTAARVRRGSALGEVAVRRDRGVVHAEGYRLRVAITGIEITAATDAGAFYGIQTLRELISIYGLRLPCCEIEDAPAFARRGIYHDCSRGKVPKVSTVKALIEFLARFKINELQLYLENVFTFQKHPSIGKGFSPYTPEDLLEMQDHARKYHVNFVPSLTSFGHFEKILMLPEYSSLGEYPGFRNLPGGTTLCPTDPRSIRLLADMYEDFLPHFAAEDFNVCGDEPWELGKGRSKRRADRLGLGRVYLDFILKVHKLCLKHGKRMNLWSDIVLDHPEMIPEIPRDIVMLNWDYGTTGKRIDRSHEIVEAGLPWVACPGTHGWLSHGSRINDSLENTSYFARVAVENGAEGFMTTDWGDGGHRQFLGVCLSGMAHGAAHAWHTNGVVDKTHLRRFTRVVFGDTSGQLARSIAVLGAKESGQWAYSALVESLVEPKTLATGFAVTRCHIDQVGLTGTRLNARMDKLLALPWAAPSESMETFLRQALDEFPVATEMERLAYRRVLLARTVRGDRRPASRELKKHASELEGCAGKFARLWRVRNRPSRLRDNLNGFRNAAREARSLV
jgi:hypothetical protein